MCTRSPISNGCFTNRNIHDPRNSCAVAENTNDKESSVVDAVERIVRNPVSKKLTIYMSV